MILVDTSVWIDHLRTGEPHLVALLERSQVLMHPFVLGELACGNLRRRADVLRHLGALPRSPVATDDEVLRFIEVHRLMGKGIGWIDVHLLAAVALSPGTRLWTRDRRLDTVARTLG
ncbi:MAG TPA: type II toxin-antitoxin system VapC family toxin, partial [Chromatiales bacterium]|nr:type II toxin-antitoxin system VapC family toxin [Chromatiales bacterium]